MLQKRRSIGRLARRARGGKRLMQIQYAAEGGGQRTVEEQN